ncbi:MAG: DUF547 domain-containing protein [Verrucomicrobia bacterium]|nr:DUF547 domain-containing protein [Verrucomicrobiota bacterium]MDA1065964.1 DUF547 domain-containing protein [Verrucomicrobiota bacterium]
MTSKLKRSFVLSLTLFLGHGLVAGFDHSHKDWDTILGTHVHGALVDYASLSDESTLLSNYLNQLNSVSLQEMDDWSREQQMAFWINAYNAFTVQAVLDHYPIKTRTIKGLVVPRNSIIQIPGVWKKLQWKVAGELLTIEYIEHGILRPKFNEPRMHFAIVCASIGCPDLRPEAFTFDQLDRQLEEQTRKYLTNAEKGVKFDFEKTSVCVSQLFKWYTDDFLVTPDTGFKVERNNEKERIAFQFISYFITEPRARRLLQSKHTDLDFLSYDWSLNEFSHPDG